MELAYAGAMSLYLSGDEAANNLLSTDPLALVVGMVLDQQKSVGGQQIQQERQLPRTGLGTCTSRGSSTDNGLSAKIAKHPLPNRAHWGWTGGTVPVPGWLLRDSD
jgi:hypothetical protein